jgi:hypothetical protein
VGSKSENGRQALLLSLVELVQLPGQVLRFYPFREYEQILVDDKIKVGLFGSLQ